MIDGTLRLLRPCLEEDLGDLSDAARTQAVYFVQWTVDAPEHFPNRSGARPMGEALRPKLQGRPTL